VVVHATVELYFRIFVHLNGPNEARAILRYNRKAFAL
jgi:hypothetical protein